LSESGLNQDVEASGYILEIQPKVFTIVGSPRKSIFYSAQLLDAISRTMIMRDGPPSSRAVLPEDIRQYLDYRLTFFGVEDNLAYVDQGELEALTLRTFQKINRAVKAYERGAEHPYDDECCYCLPP